MGSVALDRERNLRWLERLAGLLAEQAGPLTELDAAIGDADHGINMERGFNAVKERVLAQAAGKDLGTVLKQVGTTLVSTVGGAGGPLYGTFFLRMGQSADGKSELDAQELRNALAAGVEGVRQRGRAQPGDKTMLDALVPALEALDAALAAGGDNRAAWEAAARAAEEGSRATVPMLARKGRASYLGERSIGHQDPGATSSALLIRSLAEAVDG
jgi:dihydroxyacetone kinase-like protein